VLDKNDAKFIKGAVSHLSKISFQGQPQRGRINSTKN
jgi:hypothetical protein